jgi:putative transposase
MDVLEEITHIWIIDVYSRSYHRGLRDVPARVWETSMKKYPPVLPYDVNELNILLGYVAWRKVGAAIDIFGLLYSCDSLSVVRQQLKGEKAKIKYDPEDLSLIWVYDPHNGVYIPVPALDQEYTRGLTLWSHKIIMEYAKRIAEGYVNRDDLCRARDTINLVVAEGIERMKSIGLKSAHWLAQEQRRASFETGMNTAADRAPENIKTGNNGDMLNTESHPAEGISDFSGNGSAEEVSIEKVSDLGPVKFETSPAQNGAKNESKKAEENANTKKQKADKSFSRTEGESAVDDDEEIEPVDAGSESVLDKTGWSADYDLPV